MSPEENRLYDLIADELNSRRRKREKSARRTEKRKAKRLASGREWM